jgi:hypothetical protein
MRPKASRETAGSVLDLFAMASCLWRCPTLKHLAAHRFWGATREAKESILQSHILIYQ